MSRIISQKGGRRHAGKGSARGYLGQRLQAFLKETSFRFLFRQSQGLFVGLSGIGRRSAPG